MNKLKLVLALFIAMFCYACSSDEGETPVTENLNGFNFKGDFFPFDQAAIKDDNTIDDTPPNIAVVLSNVDIVNTTSQSGVNYFFFAIEATNIEVGTITSVQKYILRENTNFNDFIVSDGNTILRYDRNGNKAPSNAITIHEISASEIDLSFEFTREDGELVTGKYKGTYVRQD